MRLQPVVSILCVISASPFLYGQSSEPSDIDLLKAQVAAQAKQLEAQQKRIDALESTLRVIGSKSVADQPVSLVPAMNRGEGLPSLPRTGGGPEPPIPSTPAQQVVPSDSTQVENPPVPFDPDQELDVQPQETGPALKLGPAKIQMLGYVALTGFVRSTNGGGNVGTSFGSIPYSSTAPGNLTEFRLSPRAHALRYGLTPIWAPAKWRATLSLTSAASCLATLPLPAAVMGFASGRDGWITRAGSGR